MKTLKDLELAQRGIAGEYLVAGELNKKGIIASLTLKNTRGIDILASNSDASKSVGIQVKTTIHPRALYPQWMLNEKADDYYSDTLFYIFVLLKEGRERHDFYIVPSKIVANHTKFSHRAWLKKMRDNSFSRIRKFSDKDKKFLERWDLLGLD